MVKRCHICDQDALIKKRYGQQGLSEGVVCPVCYRPTCRYHLATVRWRWRENRELGSALVCKECVHSYAHRNWDAFNRDWIT